MPRGVSNIYDLVMAAAGLEPLDQRWMYCGGGMGWRIWVAMLAPSTLPMDIKRKCRTLQKHVFDPVLV